MKTLNLNKDGKKYKAYISPDGFGSYEYMLYEVVEKKHWWSFSKSYIGCGIICENIEAEIISRIENEIKKQNKIDCLNEQFDKL